ncbi:hypothetical protein M1247_12440 [Mycobacterium sp. 21AC1]|uniref:hypothetical protein n=1 Tax=[Mycobacterium] appelbergii TaxID=2939269 RepID=UPI0029392756|nr:hypothetical protein [Mycobacterium sp. 21AC1]MDV3125727.1 hypothetical protein [Mycobacterium sp. 21AC1]
MTTPHFEHFEIAVKRLSKIASETRSAVDAWEDDFHRVAGPTLSRLETAIRSLEGLASEDWMGILARRQGAKSRGYATLHELKEEGLIEGTTFDRAKTLIDVLFNPNTVYSSIAPDDGGVTFYWRAGEMSVGIDIYAGEGYWWRVRNVAAETYSGHGSELPLDQLKYSLNWFSKDVDRENPHWRQQPI